MSRLCHRLLASHTHAYNLCALICPSNPPTRTQRYGASSLVLDARSFVTFNPFSIYVTQADVKPGCVLRAANVRQALYRRGLLTDDEVGRSNLQMTDVVVTHLPQWRTASVICLR